MQSFLPYPFINPLNVAKLGNWHPKMWPLSNLEIHLI